LSKTAVDFLVIGASKSGTTALFRHMRKHSELYLPAQKEINFFSNKDRFSRGVGWYIETYFGGADERKLWGEVSPQYMMYGSAPARIYHSFPHVKLVAILRNPIDRVYAHYRMEVSSMKEDRTFSQVIAEQSRFPPELPDNETGDDSDYLVSSSRYGRALGSYLRYFEKEQILVLFQEDFLNSPADTMQRLFSFLGVDASYMPPNLGKKYNVAGTRWFPDLEQWIENRRAPKKVAKSVLGPKRVEAARFWFRQQNVKPVEYEGPPIADRQILKGLFDQDVDLLKQLFSLRTPWPEFEGVEEEGPSNE